MTLPIAELDKEAFEIYQREGTHAKGAKVAGINESTFKSRVHRHKQRISGDAVAPDGYKVKGTSTLYNNKGEVVAQWVKTDQDRERLLAMLKEAVSALSSTVVPAEPIIPPETTNNDLLALYTLSDFHIGMFAHLEESGDDWSTDKAAETLSAWADTATRLTPNAHTAVLLNNGDFLHFDGLDPVTPKSRHVLDADSRFQKIVAVAVRGIRYAVARLLEKHEHVHLIMADGNHDQASSVWLREIFSALYENEPRVTVDKTEHPYYAFEWGVTSIFAHHGDKRNISNVSQVVAALYREIFGRTKYSYCHLGHVHHAASKEDSLMHVIVHPTLASKDAYAARYGYISQRAARVHIYHKQYGEVGSISITPEMLK